MAEAYSGPMTFWEAVRDARKRGLIGVRWRASDLRPHLEGAFSLNTIRTVPANQSITRDGKTKGNYVLRGRSPEAYRVGEGVYELIDGC